MSDPGKATILLRQMDTLLNLVGPEDYELAQTAVRQAAKDLALKHEREIVEHAIHLLAGKEETSGTRD